MKTQDNQQSPETTPKAEVLAYEGLHGRPSRMTIQISTYDLNSGQIIVSRRCIKLHCTL